MNKGEVKTLNKNMLRSVMVLHDDTNNDLAEYLGISASTLSCKMNETNGAEFTQGEIKRIKTRYHLTAEQVDNIFLC
jgi:DNA-binding Xre family transcriptional regulator